MRPLIEIITSKRDDIGAFRPSDGERIMGIIKREVRIFGLTLVESRKAIFASETRLFSILIKRNQHEGWEVEKDPPASL